MNLRKVEYFLIIIGIILCIFMMLRTADAHGLSRIGACGAHAYVSSSYAGRFQGFVNELCRSGYPIKSMGGWRSRGSCRGCNMHPRGLALDVNQFARNYVRPRMGGNVSAMARRHGLYPGAYFSSPDTGHFEVAGIKNYSRHGRKHRRHYYARHNRRTQYAWWR